MNRQTVFEKATLFITVDAKRYGAIPLNVCKNYITKFQDSPSDVMTEEIRDDSL